MSKDNQHIAILSKPFEEIMGDRFGRYSKYIIQERALPDARDGLKPVQRRILYAMYHDGNTYDKPYRKSAKTVGLVIGNYHPHGDSSVYDAMIRMSQWWKMNHVLIDVHGNNGSIDDDPAAAMRYTEARLSKLANELITDIDKDTVLFSPNFDDTENEPVVFPAGYPSLLVNGSTGIAAGYATNIPPHNMGEVIDAAIYRLQNPDCTLDDLIQLVKGPDFPTGGIIQGKAGIKDAFATGKGRIVVRSRCEIVQTKTATQIVVTEIPFEVIKANIVKKMDEIRINKDIDGIIDVRDESDRNGLRIVVELKKDVDANLVLNYMYKNTDLQVYYNYNMVAIVDQRPVQMGLSQLIDAYLVHREEVVLRRSRFLLNKLSKRCHILEGLMRATSIMDEIIQLIRQSKDKADAKRRLMEAFQFSEEQAEAIVILRLYRLTSTDIVALKEEYAEIMNQITDLRAIIEDQYILRSTIISELKEIKAEFAHKRLSVIEDEIEEIVIDKVSMISNERVMVSVSQDGYIKNVSLRSYQASIPALPGAKENDVIIGYREVDTLDSVISFTSNGEYGIVPMYQVSDARWKDVGTHLNSYIKFDSFNKLVASLIVKSFNTEAWVVSITKKGMIKRSPLSSYELTRTSKASMAMKLRLDDEVVATFIAYYDDDIVMLTKQGFMLRYPLATINPTAPKAQGVIAMNVAKDDEVVDGCAVTPETTELVIISHKGTFKRLKTSDVSVMGRAVKGERIFKQVKSNPVYARYVLPCQIHDAVVLFDEQKHELEVKDIAIMAKDATFSAPLALQPSWYLLKGIPEVLMKDFHEPEKPDYEFTQLEL